MMALYWVFRRAPKGWWIIGSIVAMLFFILGTIIAPVYIEPLFNKYTPLEDAKIRDPILQLARANEIPVNKVFVVDASRQTKRVSANVSGLFNTTRIALNDNLLKQCTLPEIREVMAHEMGHYVLNHIMKFFAFVALLTLVAFGLAKLTFEWALKRWGESWRVRGIADPAGWPLLILIFAVLGFLGTPINNTLIRTQEREADAFGLNAAREPDASAKVALKLGKYRKMEPTPLEEFLLFDHPSGRSRIRMAMDWKYANLP
jgi:STE24 endopeptidase